VAVADSPGWLKCTKDAAATLQSVATIIALLVGAWWVLRRRRTYPRANFKHIVSHVPLDDDTYLVRVTIAIENVGDVLLRLEESVGAIQQVVPLHDQLRPALKARGTLGASDQSELAWPFIDTRRRTGAGTRSSRASRPRLSSSYSLHGPCASCWCTPTSETSRNPKSTAGIRRLSTNLNSQERLIYDR
jgi:hypothetical protein